MMYITAILTLCISASGTLGSIFAHKNEDPCPNVTVVSSLDIQKFVGKWYQHASYGNMFIHGLDKCVSTEYKIADDNITIIMNNQRQVVKANTILESTWKAVVKNETAPDGNLTLTLRFPFYGSREISLLVIGTDYDNYAVMVACGKVGFLKFLAGYIFTRKAVYSVDGFANIKKDVDKILDGNILKYEDFSATDQSECDAPATVQETMTSILKKGLKIAISGGSLALILG